VRAMLGTLDHGQVYGVLQALLEGDARGLIEAVRHLAEQGPDWAGVLAEILNVLHRVAIAQALPEAVDNGQGDRDRVLALAQALPAEDVQFYYQMGLIGRRDLPLAPEPRSGFEMVLLRMLAFRPAGSSAPPTAALKPLGISPASADSQLTPVAVAVAASALPSAAVVEPLVEPSVAPVTSVLVDVVAVAAPVLQPAEAVAPAPVEAAPVSAAEIDLPWNEPVLAAQVSSTTEPSEVYQVHPSAHEAPVVVDVLPAVAPVSAFNDADADADETDDEAEDDVIDADVAYAYLESLPDDSSAALDLAEPVLPAALPATGLAAQWLELFPQLGLSGLTGSIAGNCCLVAVEGDHWSLHLDPAQGALFNSTQQQRVNDALSQFYGRKLTLTIELCKPEQETPAQAAARQRIERQSQAVAAIHADPLVQKMLQQFAASVRADSIEPIDV
jgi:DNA polymerase-3 subunit gamma/tau